ncbi:MAG: BTAD domain-containing putative transcriptional regulator, partial [Thermomicrobiales bacterium]
MLHVRLLGPFQFRYGDVTATGIDMPRIQSLISCLILRAGTPISRQSLAFTFWPDSTDQQARTNLRQLLHRLRRAWSDIDRYLALDDTNVCWRLDAPFTLDVHDLEDALRQSATAEQDADPAASCAALTHAVCLYTDDLLPDCYDDWIVPERERLRQEFLSAIAHLISLLENRRDYATAIQHAERRLRFDPLNESTWRDLMRLHALTGNRNAALDVYNRCRAILKRELDVEPDLATHDLYLRLLNAGDVAAIGWPEQTIDTPRIQPLVGRQREWDAMQLAWRRSHAGYAQLCVISGEAGVGKTRLAEELLTWAGRQGFTTARTRCYAAAGGLAYAPIADWLRAEDLRAHWPRLDPAWLAEIGRLLPELRA